jgi:hypothetical protein
MPSVKRIARETAARDSVARERASNSALQSLARMFARNPNGPGMVPHTTSTGRALSVGKVTRKSNAVRKHARGEVQKPLPFGLAVHPMRLTPTPKHPECKTAIVSDVDVYVLSLLTTRKEFEQGKGLSKRKQGRRWAIRIDGKTCGYCYDPMHGVTWVRAALRSGLTDVIMVDIG